MDDIALGGIRVQGAVRSGEERRWGRKKPEERDVRDVPLG